MQTGSVQSHKIIFLQYIYYGSSGIIYLFAFIALIS